MSVSSCATFWARSVCPAPTAGAGRRDAGFRDNPLRGWPRSVLLRGARSAPADRATPPARTAISCPCACKSSITCSSEGVAVPGLPPKERHVALLARMSRRESPPRFHRLQKPAPPAFREVHRLLPAPEHSGMHEYQGRSTAAESLCCETSVTLNFGSSRLLGPWLPVGWWGGHLLSARFLNRLRSGLIEPPKQKSHRQVDSGGGILELLAMILEYLAPGARRRTRTAGTTEASLLGLLDVWKSRGKGTEWQPESQ